MDSEQPTQAELALKSLADEALAFKRSPRLTFVTFPVRADAKEIETALKISSFGDLLLNQGDSMSLDGGDDHRYELDLFIGKASLAGVSLRVFGWEDDKYRIDPDGPQEVPYDVIAYPGEKDWAREITIQLWYTNGKEDAAQELSVYVSSNPRVWPTISRQVCASAYAETGYEGHNQLVNPGPAEEKVLEEFTAIARRLFEKAVKPKQLD